MKTRLAALALGTYLARRALRRSRRMDLRGASVLITGGSRGLGLELARAFGREGANLTLLARHADDLARAADDLDALGAPVHTVAADVRNQEAAARAVREATERFGRVDVLVNNAGIITVGPEAHMSEGDYRRAMETHYWGAYYLMQAVREPMRAQGGGRILNVASIGGLAPVPHLAPYVGSKHALVGLSDTLRAEWASDRIRITTVAPGLMRTGSHVNVWTKGQHGHEFTWFALSNALPLLSISSYDAAQRLVEAARYGEAHVTLTLPAKMLRILNGLAPSLVAEATTLAEGLLPARTGAVGDRPQRGYENPTTLAPSVLTHPADRNIARNHELMPGKRAAYEGGV